MLTRKQPLKRTSRLRSGGSLQQVSKKKARANSQQQKAYREVERRAQWCETCGGHTNLQHSHTLTQKQFPLLAAHPLNIDLECAACHTLYEHQKTEYARRYPEAFTRRYEVMRQLAPQYAAFFRMKHPHLFDAR